MDSLYDFTFSRLEDSLRDAGIKALHAKEVYRAIYKVSGILVPTVQAWVDQRQPVEITVVRDIASSDGETRKFLLRCTMAPKSSPCRWASRVAILHALAVRSVVRWAVSFVPPGRWAFRGI